MAIVAVQQPTSRRKDPLESLAQGLSIAQSVFGIKSALEMDEIRQKQMAQAEKAEERAVAQESRDAERFRLEKAEKETAAQRKKAGGRDVKDFEDKFLSIPEDERQQLERQTGIAIPLSTIDVFNPQTGLSEKRQGIDRELFNKIVSTRLTTGAKKPTAGAFQAAGFAKRIRDAEADLLELENAGFNRASIGTSIGVGVSDFFGSIGMGGFTEFFKSSELKRFEQARRNFINAVLREESGAVISDAEFENAEIQYFPVIGDDFETIQQKRRNRATVLAAYEKEAEGLIEPSAGPVSLAGRGRDAGISSSSILPSAQAGGGFNKARFLQKNKRFLQQNQQPAYGPIRTPETNRLMQTGTPPVQFGRPALLPQ